MKQNNEALWKQRAFYVVKKETIMELMVPIEIKTIRLFMSRSTPILKERSAQEGFAPEADCLLPGSLQAIFM